jgi:tetratricopeptide (TPR) repeat protein
MTFEFAELEKLGIDLYEKGNIIGSLRFFERGLKIALDARDPERCARAHFQIGIIMLEKDEVFLAGENFRIATALFKKTGDYEKAKAASFNYGKVLCISGNYKEALKRLRFCLEISQNEAAPEFEAGIYLYAGIANYHLDYLDASYDYLTKSSRLFMQAQDKKGIADTLYYLGKLYIKAEDFAKAKHYFEEAVIAYNELRDAANIAEAASGLAEILVMEEKYGGAATLLNCAAGFFFEAGLTGKYASALGFLGETYYKNKDYDLAEAELLKASPILKNENLTEEEGRVKRLLASVYLETKRTGQAHDTMLEAVELFMESRCFAAAIESLADLADICLAEGYLREARHFLLEALAICQSSGVNSQKASIGKVLDYIEQTLKPFEKEPKHDFFRFSLKKLKII